MKGSIMLNYLASFLPLKNPQREAKAQLKQCQLERLDAEASKEHWEARVLALKNRERRLLAQVAADELVAEQQAREYMSRA
jgi:hypothetical protein